MTVTALASASLWDSLYFPGNLNTEPRAQRSATVVEGAPASLRSADDSYTPGRGAISTIQYRLRTLRRATR
jgi:hypothetical protein